VGPRPVWAASHRRRQRHTVATRSVQVAFRALSAIPHIQTASAVGPAACVQHCKSYFAATSPAVSDIKPTDGRTFSARNACQLVVRQLQHGRDVDGGTCCDGGANHRRDALTLPTSHTKLHKTCNSNCDFFVMFVHVHVVSSHLTYFSSVIV
jgi:hypothetical protein